MVSIVTVRALAKTPVMIFAQLLMANQCQPVLPSMSVQRLQDIAETVCIYSTLDN
jgi:hypothetical protein